VKEKEGRGTAEQKAGHPGLQITLGTKGKGWRKGRKRPKRGVKRDQGESPEHYINQKNHMRRQMHQTTKNREKNTRPEKKEKSQIYQPQRRNTIRRRSGATGGGL